MPGIDENDYLKIYLDVKKNGKLHINPDLFNFTRSNLISAIEKVYPGIDHNHRDFDLMMKLRNNASRFSGYKTAWQVSELLEQEDDLDIINAINKKYNTNWMRTEYEHTVRSTRAAKNWQNYTADADLYPYLEYMPSTAGEPRNEHKKLYGVIKKLDDPFWDTWLPPADWGCKCSVQQRRSDKGTTQPPDNISKPPLSMRNNPGKDGQVFTNKHPMISKVDKKTAAMIESEVKERTGNVMEAWAKFKAYGSEWEKVDFNIDNGGYNVYHNDHQFHKRGGTAEKKVGKFLMNNEAKQAEFLPEKGIGIKKPDIAFDGKTWDIKSIDNANADTLRKYIREAAKKADNVIFYDFNNDRHKDVLKAADRQFGRYKKESRAEIMPGIYLMNLNGDLVKIR